MAPEIKEDRSNRLIDLGKKLLKEYAENYLGKSVEVLVEQKTYRDGQIYWEGHSCNYLNIVFPAGESRENFKGRLIDVQLERYQDGAIFGHLLINRF